MPILTGLALVAVSLLIAGAIFVLVATVLPLWLSAYVLGVLTTAYYFGVFSMSWDLLFGFAGEVNFGPTFLIGLGAGSSIGQLFDFLIGLGAYTAALLDNAYHPPVVVCIAVGALAALVGGVLLALPALRLRGPYFGLVTLVAVLLLQNAIVIFARFTGGEIGMTVPDVMTIDPKLNYWSSSRRSCCTDSPARRWG